MVAARCVSWITNIKGKIKFVFDLDNSFLWRDFNYKYVLL